MNLRNNKGVTGADVAVAITILILFTSFIAGLFYNISNTSKKIERKSTATDLAIEVIETLKQIPMEDLPVIQDRVEIANSNISEITSIEVKNGYKCYVKIIDYNDAGIAKILTVDVEYQIGKQNQTETVNIETLVKSENEIIIAKGIFPTLYTDGTLGFSTEKDKFIEGKTVLKAYDNIAGITFTTNGGAYWHENIDKIKTINFVDIIYPVSTSHWFEDCSQLIQIDNITNLKTDNTKDMYRMFYGCSKLQNLNLSHFNTTKLENIAGLVYGCTSLETINVSNWDTSNVTSMNNVFYDCESLKEIDLSNWNTSNVITMEGMFGWCSSLTELNLSNFNTSKVTLMDYMFCYCSKLQNLNVSNFDTSKVTNMREMFSASESLTILNLVNFNTSNVTNMQSMFWKTTKLTKISVGSGWDESNADTTSMFSGSGCSSVTRI